MYLSEILMIIIIEWMNHNCIVTLDSFVAIYPQGKLEGILSCIFVCYSKIGEVGLSSKTNTKNMDLQCSKLGRTILNSERSRKFRFCCVAPSNLDKASRGALPNVRGIAFIFYGPQFNLDMILNHLSNCGNARNDKRKLWKSKTLYICWNPHQDKRFLSKRTWWSRSDGRFHECLRVSERSHIHRDSGNR